MTSKDQRPSDAAELRLRAEAMVREEAARSPKDLQAPSPEESLRMLHDLRVHQVQLEMQNDELRRTQAELVAARARYFDLYDLAPVGYCTLSETGLILEANLTAATLLGVARGDLVTQRLSRFILKEDEGLYYRHRKLLFDTGEPQACELRMVRPDGPVFWAHLEAAAAHDAGGAPVCRVTLSDNPERERTEQALRESEARFRSVYEDSTLGMYRTTPDGRIVLANPALVEMLGYTSFEELAARNLAQPDAYEPGYSRAEFLQRIDASREVRGLESGWRRKDGTTLAVRENVRAVRDATGRLLHCDGVVEDITERKRAENALRQAEERLELFFSQSLDGFFFMMLDEPVHWNDAADKERVLDYVFAHQRVTKINDPMLAQYGATREQFTGLTPNSMFAHDIPYGRRVWREFFDAGHLHIDTDERRFDGTKMWVEGDYICMYDTAGRITGHFGIQRDITERKRVEEALRTALRDQQANRMHYEQTVSMLSDVVWRYEVDAQGRFVNSYVSPVADRLLGLPAGTIGDDVEKSLTLVHPDDLTAVREALLEGLHTKQDRVELDYRMIKPDGTILWVRSRGSARAGDHGATVGYGTTSDITERKRVEEELRESESSIRALFESSPIGLEMYDATGRLVRANAACLTLFGLASVEPIRGFDLFADPNLTEALKAALRRGESVRYQGPFDFERVRELSLYPTTRRGIIELDVMIQLLPGGRGYQVEIQDITDRKRAEETRDALQAQLLQAQKADSLGRMAGAIAHNYNNLLGAVLLNLELAQSKLPPDAGARKYLADATKTSQRAAEISQQMLAYLGQARGRRVPTDLCETCREALPLLRAALPRNARLRTEFPAEGAVIRADALQLKRVLTYLAANAGEAIGDGGGSVTVAIDVIPAADIHAPRFFPAGWEPRAETYVCLSVADTGCGMTPEILDKAFDPFFSTKFTGRGLGLPVVTGIVMAHEGACAAESSPELGTTLRVYLPCIVEQPLQLPTAEPAGSGAVEGRGLVLVVEDDPMLRDLTRTVLENLGYKVVEAADGAAAVEVFRQHQDQIRCVLCDLTMPRLDGWATLKALRGLRPDVAVILTSGYDEAQVMAGEQADRPQAFLHKPYASADLEAALDAALKETY